MIDAMTKCNDGVLSFDLELPEEISDAIGRVFASYGAEGRFMICQPQCRGEDARWRLRGRILNREHFKAISDALEGQTEIQKYNHRKNLKGKENEA